MSSDLLDQVEKLSELHEKGILTKEEFQQKKTELLNRLSVITKTLSVPSEAERVIVRSGSYWLPVPSMIFGLLALLACLDDSGFDLDTITGLATFSIASLTLGIISISNQRKGKGMAITGIITSSIAILFLIGLVA